MKKKYIYISIIVLTFLILISTFSFAIAKYVKNKNGGMGIIAEDFYFTVDLLGDTISNEDLKKSYTLAGGDEKEIIFNVQNYFDAYRVNEADITYKVQMEITSTKIDYDKSQITLSKVVDTNYKLTKNAMQSDEWKLKIPTGYGNNTKVVIKIASSKPYVKEMELEFIFLTYESEFSYEVLDEVSSPVARLIIKTNVDIPVGTLTIDFSQINVEANILQIDTTDEYIVDIVDGIPKLNTNALKPGETYYKSVVNTIKINAGEAVEIIFFKTDITQDYSMSLVTSNSVDGKFSVIIN